MWGSMRLKLWSRSQFSNYAFESSSFARQNGPKSTFFERILFSSIPAVGEA